MLALVASLTLPVAAPIPEGRPEGLVIWSATSGGNKKADEPRWSAGSGAWTPDGKHVLTAGWSTLAGPQVGEVRVWDAATGKHVRTFLGSAASYFSFFRNFAISPDGKTVVAGGRRNYLDAAGTLNSEDLVEPWDWTAERPRVKLGGFECYVSGITFSPDGRRLLAIDHREGNLRGWDVATGRQVVRAKVAATWWRGLALHPRRLVLAGTDCDGNVLTLDTATGNVLATVSPRLTGKGFMSVAFAPDGRAVACGAAEYAGKPPLVVIPIRIGEAGAVSAGEPIVSRDEVGGGMYEVAYSPDGRLIAAACHDRTVRLYDADNAQLLAFAAEHDGPVYSVVFSPDGRRLLSVGRDAVKVWSVAELRNRRPTP